MAQKRRRGQIIPKGPNKWLVRVYVGRIDGKRKYKSEAVSGPYSEAQKALTGLLSAVDQGEVGPVGKDGNVTLQAYAEASVNGREIEPRTRASYLNRLQLDIFPWFGKVKLRDLTPADLREHFQFLKGEPRNLSARSRKYVYQILKSVLNDAVRDRLIPRNPMDEVDAPRIRKRDKVHEIHPLTTEEMEKFLESAKGSRNYPLWLTLLTTGIRPGEARALTWDNVHLDADTPYLEVVAAVSEDEDGKDEIRGTKTEASVRRVTLPQRTVRALEAHRATLVAEMLREGYRTDLVFPSERGTLYSRTAIRESWLRALKRAGLAKRRLYDARHTHATWLLNQGVNPKVAAERLGHASTKMFLDVYAHVTKEAEDEALQKLNAAFG